MTEEVKVEDFPTEPAPEPKGEPKEAEAPAEGNELASLMAELERAGVSNAEQLAGKLEASQQVGQMANLLGEARERIRRLETKPNTPPTQTPEYGDESVDLEQLVIQAMRKEREREKAITSKAQMAATATWHAIQNDEDYPLVKDVWEAKLSDPTFIMRMRNSGSTPVDEYTKTVRGYYKGISKRALDTISKLQGSGVVSPPHVEGEAGVPSMRGKESPNKTELKKLQEDINKGKLLSEQDELDALDKFFASPG